MNTNVVTQTELPGIALAGRGKVRDVYDLGDRLLIVSTDRISAFDVILQDPIPDKGRVLNKLSVFWLEKTHELAPNHLISADVADFPEQCREFAGDLEGRTMMVRKAKPFPVECVVRGYLIGSGWKDYRKTGTICGIQLPAGLKMAEKLPEPIFTPSTKAEIGAHDENISFERVKDLVGTDTANRLRDKTIEIYLFGSKWAEDRGIIIADTKFEFGLLDGEPILIDEVLTPDSSRFWPRDQYRVGMSPPSLDKQFVRDFLEGLDWDKKPPAPHLPEDVIAKTRANYLDLYAIITGQSCC